MLVDTAVLVEGAFEIRFMNGGSKKLLSDGFCSRKWERSKYPNKQVQTLPTSSKQDPYIL